MDKIMWAGTVRALPLSDQLKAARLAGCNRLSVTPLGYTQWLAAGTSTADMLAMAADEGVKLDQLDPITRWHSNWRPAALSPELCPLSFLSFTSDDFFRIAEALQVQRISAIVTGEAGASTPDNLVADFAALCDRAAELGLSCDLEFIPMWALPDLASAWRVLSQAGRRNSGLVFDFWHYMRGAQDPDLLATIPGDRISCVQLCDGLPAPYAGDLLEDCLHHRLPAGAGAFPVADLVSQLRAIGALGSVGHEIFSMQFDGLGPEEIASRCRTADAALGLNGSGEQ